MRLNAHADDDTVVHAVARATSIPRSRIHMVDIAEIMRLDEIDGVFQPVVDHALVHVNVMPTSLVEFATSDPSAPIQ